MDEADETLPKLDRTSLHILRRVEADRDVNLEELADELELSKSAIHYRLENLKEQGVIEGESADIDPVKLGLNMLIITQVSVVHEPGYAEDIGTQIADVDGVQHVYYTMGDVDFVVISRTQNRDQMNKLIDDIVNVEGVNETSSRFVMQEIKTDGTPIANMSEDMIGNLVDDE